VMSKVELIYDNDCPNVAAAREQLRRAFQEVGVPANWQEWDRGNPSSPDYARRYGSPTILVEGRDVASGVPAERAACCRLYRSEGGFQGVPPANMIAAALRNRTTTSSAAGGLPSWLAILPAIGVAMLPKLACPACWPAYAGLLSSIGLGFLTQTAYLFPLTITFLAVAVGALGFRARSRRVYGPFVAGLVAAVVVIVGKFLFESDPAMYGGIALLIGASVWNTWPRRKTNSSCPACAGAGNQ
jgi:mercuric ion transport protein